MTKPKLKSVQPIRASQTEKPTLRCHSNIFDSIDSIESVGLLSPARMEEVRKILSPDAFAPAKLEGGAMIHGWEVNKYTGSMFFKCEYNNARHINETILNRFLTEGEITLFNKLASEIRSQKREDERFAQAEKIPASKWNGKVYWSDEYYDGLDCFEESFLDNFDTNDCSEEDRKILNSKESNNSVYDKIVRKYFPKYIWAVDEEEKVIDFDSGEVVEWATNGKTWEDFNPDKDLHGLAEFELAVKKFKEQNETVVSYHPSYRLAIELGK